MSEVAVNIAELVEGDGFRKFRGGRIASDTKEMLVASDVKKLSVVVEDGVSASLLIIHTKSKECGVEIELMTDSALSVVELFLESSFSDVKIRQSAGSRCDFTVVELASGNASYFAELNGENAGWRFGGVFVGTDFDRCAMSLNTRHNVPDCRSESVVKGVVSGRASGEFRGLVYVAPDAQRTDACQQSRNIELSADAHIVTKPQLEIYADDVKCSHGATVGHRDEEALFYMRQRGLSERDAQRVQIEGFVKDVVSQIGYENLREALEAEIDNKLQKL